MKNIHEVLDPSNPGLCRRCLFFGVETLPVGFFCESCIPRVLITGLHAAYNTLLALYAGVPSNRLPCKSIHLPHNPRLIRS